MCGVKDFDKKNLPQFITINGELRAIPSKNEFSVLLQSKIIIEKEIKLPSEKALSEAKSESKSNTNSTLATEKLNVKIDAVDLSEKIINSEPLNKSIQIIETLTPETSIKQEGRTFDEVSSKIK